MKVFIIREDCSPEYKHTDFLSIHLMKVNAIKKLKQLKKKDPYTYQYLEIEEAYLRK